MPKAEGCSKLIRNSVSAHAIGKPLRVTCYMFIVISMASNKVSLLLFLGLLFIRQGNIHKLRYSTPWESILGQLLAYHKIPYEHMMFLNCYTYSYKAEEWKFVV